MKDARSKLKLKAENRMQKYSKLTHVKVKKQFFSHFENRRHCEYLRKELSNFEAQI
jgi:hypothetical protein